MLRFAFERKVVTHADNGANLNFVSEEALEALVKYPLRSITCSIDGASPETYEKYRVRGNFDKVIANIRRINEYKRQYKSGFAMLNWQFIIFGHNEHEIGAVRNWRTNSEWPSCSAFPGMTSFPHPQARTAEDRNTLSLYQPG